MLCLPILTARASERSRVPLHEVHVHVVVNRYRSSSRMAPSSGSGSSWFVSVLASDWLVSEFVFASRRWSFGMMPS